MKEADFEKLVAEAIESLPESIRRKMDNIEVIVEQGSPNGPFLGLYQGIPKTGWGRGFGMNLPDKITIFQAPIENSAKTFEEIKELVRNTVWHEIAHHFGFSEKGVKALERKRKK
ncbi:MAG: metallopeptidase family protein [bacterium]